MLPNRFLFLVTAAIVLLSPFTTYAAFDSAEAAKLKTLEIIRVTPDGEDVPTGKQIVIQFNRPVVPIGKMERPSSEIPVIITPAIPCEWRWINTSALACNLPDKEPLREATHYTLEIKPGIKAEDDVTIPDTYHHSFITQRSDIRYKEFRLWKSPGYPIMRLVFNQPVDKESVAQHVFLNVGDDNKRVALKVKPDPTDHEQPQFIPVPGERYALLFKKAPSQKSDDDLRKKSGKEARRIWLIEPVRELPLDTHIVLKTEPGLISALGPEASITSNEIVQFDTYPEFTFVGVKCTMNDGKELLVPADTSPTGKCNPMQGVQLSFTTPVERDKMGKMVKFTPPVGGWKESDEETQEAETTDNAEGGAEVGYQFRQPHSKGKTYEVWLPGGLKAAQEYTVQSRSQTMNIFEWLWHWIKSWFKHQDPIEVQDMFGREMRHSISSTFATDHRNPNFVLDYSDAVLEKGVDSEVPFFVNNLNNYTFNYRRLTAKSSDDGQTFHKDVPGVKDVQFAVPFGVRDMLDEKQARYLVLCKPIQLSENITLVYLHR